MPAESASDDGARDDCSSEMSREGEKASEPALRVCVLVFISGALALAMIPVGSMGLAGAVCMVDMSAEDACPFKIYLKVSCGVKEECRMRDIEMFSGTDWLLRGRI